MHTFRINVIHYVLVSIIEQITATKHRHFGDGFLKICANSKSRYFKTLKYTTKAVRGGKWFFSPGAAAFFGRGGGGECAPWNFFPIYIFFLGGGWGAPITLSVKPGRVGPVRTQIYVYISILPQPISKYVA